MYLVKLKCIFSTLLLTVFIYGKNSTQGRKSHKIIFLMAHPRAASTAFECSMLARRDHMVFHEPFVYLYYYHNKLAAPASGAQPKLNNPKTYIQIKNMIFRAAREKPVFVKDMPYYSFKEMIEDSDFLSNPDINFVFLVRDPKKTISSHYLLNPFLQRDEIGYDKQFLLYNKISKLRKKSPMVIDSDDFIDHPEAILRAFSKHVGISFSRRSLSWDDSILRELDKQIVWKKWHKNLFRSKGFSNRHQNKTSVAGKPWYYLIANKDRRKILAMYFYHLPFFEKLFAEKYKL